MNGILLSILVFLVLLFVIICSQKSQEVITPLQEISIPEKIQDVYIPEKIPGHLVGEPMNVPVPIGTMRQFSPRLNHQFTRTAPGLHFIGSVDAYAPFKDVDTQYERIGILTSLDNKEILDLFRRPIAPLQDLWQYEARDKNDFFIQLRQTRYIENNDIIDHIDGKQGPFRAHVYLDNKYVWV